MKKLASKGQNKKRQIEYGNNKKNKNDTWHLAARMPNAAMYKGGKSNRPSFSKTFWHGADYLPVHTQTAAVRRIPIVVGWRLKNAGRGG